MQRPGRQPAAAHGADQQHQCPDDEHRCAQLARAERAAGLHYKGKAALDGHRNICEPPVHSGGAAAGDIEQPPRREAHGKGQQARAVAAGPAADFFHAERPLVFVPIIKESIAGCKASFCVQFVMMQQRVFSVLHKSASGSFAQVKIYAKYTQENAHIVVDIHPPPRCKI